MTPEDKLIQDQRIIIKRLEEDKEKLQTKLNTAVQISDIELFLIKAFANKKIETPEDKYVLLDAIIGELRKRKGI